MLIEKIPETPFLSISPSFLTASLFYYFSLPHPTLQFAFPTHLFAHEDARESFVSLRNGCKNQEFNESPFRSLK